MGSSASKNTEDEEDGSNGGGGGQLYVSLKMENSKVEGELTPHVYGSVPLVGSWDPSNALPMLRESASMSELSFVVPPDHETLDFKFLLKPKYRDTPCIVEEGENRILTGGSLQGDARVALFKLEGDVIVEFRVFINADRVSPFDLAASWRAYRENLQPSTVRGIPDVSINPDPTPVENCPSESLELDLEHYEVPAPAPSAQSSLVYAADNAENPRSLSASGSFVNDDTPKAASKSPRVSAVSEDGSPSEKDMEIIVPDHSDTYSASGAGESKSAGILSPIQQKHGQRGLFVDRGVGSPRLVKSVSASSFLAHLKLDAQTKNSMPAAAGAVAAAAVADQMLGPKEDRHLAIVLVGLPARGKTFTAAKLTRYLRWLGHDTKHFNVGKYRRLKHGVNQCADFFRADNQEGVEARTEVAALAMEDMIAWMEDGGQVGVFDATNSTRVRRNMLMKMAEGKCKIIFLETLCNDERIIERNIRLKIQQSPDYEEETDFEAGVKDFRDRLANYERIQVNNISGYLPGRIVFFLVNTHLTPRPILLTRHGESMDNVRGRTGGDSVTSESGKIYAKKLANFVEKRLKNEKAASIWTSTLQRTILTAGSIVGFPKVQWRALDEINSGVCDGMTYEEIKKNMPEEYESRLKDKLRYRYPRGESYLDVIQRLEPVIIELERQRAPVVVISHQAVLRALYAYFADRPLKEIPQIEMPLHTIIEIQMGVSGVQEKRYKLMD
ncbi:PREDICTED: 6-phosphofructo-2-kinase/fructose-2,6-bisphosphatase-like isoform X2 [Brassica oleracea var. oleracea]|uniref:6-phosphofructo-2-kinase/fructose-2, 6-bisphosphatase-like isoform X2 n=1 Tax=Brassica oleracea var. oleracea TaxID=109376 RepID=UPI0006A7497C|nr:PREDICTED: 6-phosphofructo-2-kinase/fructose-2,6-bisphosphatase-like isoform X2 [Brassica oleracea var. oleracea]